MLTQLFRAKFSACTRATLVAIAFSAFSHVLSGATASGIALVRHRPSINGTVDGSVQQMSAESVTLNGGAVVTGDLLVPGFPSVRLNGKPSYAGTIDGEGADSPTTHQITLNGGASLRHVVRRVDAEALPAVAPAAAPLGTRSVTATVPAQAVGPWSTLRNLTLNGGVGDYIVPPGAYGDFVLNGGTGITLGLAGSTQPAIYHFQSLTLNGQARISLLGPVVITVAHGFAANGEIGAADQPGWLTLNVYSGGFTLNGGCSVHGFVNATNGTVIINGNSQLVGGVACDRLIVNGGGLLRLFDPVTPNQAPIAYSQSVATDEDAPVTIVLTGTDPEGQALHHSLATLPRHGTLSPISQVPSPNSQSFLYTPAPHFHGEDSFAFIVDDGLAESTPATVSITVYPLNDRPVANDQTVQTDEDVPTNITLSGADIDGDALTYAIIIPPSHGSLDATPTAPGPSPSFTYTPSPDYAGPDSFSFVVSDGSLASESAVVSITVLPVNDSPTAISMSYTVDEEHPLPITLTGTDPDGDILSFEILTQPTHGTLAGSGASWTYQPNTHFFGIDGFSFRVSDGQLASAPAFISIDVTNFNDPPAASAESVETVEDTPVDALMSASDPDGDPCSFSIVESPAHGTLGPISDLPSPDSASVTYTPGVDFHGTDQFVFVATDMFGADSEPVVVPITVTPVNDPPVAHPQSVSTPEDVSVPITLTAFDLEDAALTYEIIDAPIHGTLSLSSLAPGSSLSVTYTPASDFHGSDSFTFIVSDGELTSSIASVTIQVTPVNDAPVAHAQSLETDEDTPLDLALTGFDAENDALTFEVVVPPAHGVLSEIPDLPSQIGAALTYTPAPDFHGEDFFVFVVSDGTENSAPATVALTVHPVNDAPVALPQSLLTDRNVPVSFTLGASDIDGDLITYAMPVGPVYGTLATAGGPLTVFPLSDLSTPNLTYTPPHDFAGEIAFTFTAHDGQAASSEATITITVIATNRAPAALSGAVEVAEGGSVPVSLEASDPDGDALTYLIVTQPEHGSLVGEGATRVYTPDSGYSGPDQFTFKANDGLIDSPVATVSITVAFVDDPPVAHSQGIVTDEDTPIAITLTGSDPEGLALSYTIATQPSHGTVSPSLLAAGLSPSFTYTPSPGFHGEDDFSFTVSDGVNTSPPANVAITVTSVNDAPLLQPLAASGKSGSQITIIPTVFDADGDATSFSITSPPAHGTVTSVPGGFVYVSEALFHGIDGFIVVATDGTAISEPVQIQIVVTMPGMPPPVSAGPDRTLFVRAGGRAHAGSIVVNTDEWTLSDYGFEQAPSARQFALNLANWFKNGETGRFLVFSTDFGMVGSRLAETMRSAGHHWEVNSSAHDSLDVLLAYDAVFLDGQAANSDVLQSYVEHGGCLYICGRGFAQDQLLWNNFLERFGLRFGSAAPIVGVIPVSSSHPLFQGVASLFYFNGNEVDLLPTAEATNIEVLHETAGYRMISSYTTGRFRALLTGTLGDMPEGVDPGSLRFNWSMVEGPGLVRFSTDDALTTEAFFSSAGSYRLRLTATNDVGSTSAEVVLRLEVNVPPVVSAGPDICLASQNEEADLIGSILDDGRPLGAVVSARWSVVTAPTGANVQFADAQRAVTKASFSEVGRYTLRLTGIDTVDEASDTVVVRVGAPSRVNGPAGIAGWWPGDFTGEDRINGHNAILAAGTAFSPGWVGGAFVFDGFGGYSRVPAHEDINVGGGGSMTIEFWIKPDQIRQASILSWESGAGIRQYNDRIYPELTDALGTRHYIDTAARISTTGWTHVAIVYDWPTGTCSVFSNGVLRTSAVMGQFTPKTDTALLFGDGAMFGANRFCGSLDEIAIYRRALSITEIATIYEAGAVGRTVASDNQPPVIEAGPSLVVEDIGLPIRLLGSADDPDGSGVDGLRYSWAKVDGPGTADLDSSALLQPLAWFSAPGVYTLQLTVDDGVNSVTDQTTVRVAVPCVAGAPSGLVAWLTANHTLLDATSGLEVIPIRGAPFQNGHVGGAFTFDGSNDVIRIPASPTLDVGSGGGMSVEFWINLGESRQASILSWANGAGIRQYGTRVYPEWTDADGGRHYVDSPAAMSVGGWTHVAVTYERSAGVLGIYTNGAIRMAANVGSYTPKTDGDLILGDGALYGANRFAGGLDEVSIYNRVLSAGEVQAIFTAGVAGKCMQADNNPPVAQAGSDMSARADTPTALSGAATDDGKPNPPAMVTCSWSVVSAPGDVVFADGAALQTTATFSRVGEYVLRLTVSDSELSGFDDVAVTVTSEPPIVSIVEPADGATLAAGMPTIVCARATDPDGVIAKVEFSRNGVQFGEATTPLVGESDVFGVLVSGGFPIGTTRIVARATDGAGVFVESQEVAVNVVADPGTYPEALLVTPAADTRVCGPVSCTGLAGSRFLSAWQLEYRMKSADGETQAPWTTIASGISSVGTPASDEQPAVPGDLGTFDPTLLLNGIYELRLVVSDSVGRTVTDGPVTVVVEGNMKVGAFSLAFEDLNIPVSGIPISVVRTYDSRDARVGDFGPGWNIAVNNIRVQKNRHLGNGWWQTPQEGFGIQFYDVLPINDRIVTVVFPDGETHRFRAGAYVKVRVGDPDYRSFAVVVRSGKYRFYPVGDTSSTLEPLDDSNQLAETFWISGTGDQDLSVDDFGQVPFNPTRFRLTTRDGTVFILDEKLGLLEMRDLSGNTLTLQRDADQRVDAIVATQNADSGPIARNISIHRDGVGRVDHITDLDGNTLDYTYDAEGRLESFVDRELNVTGFRYENANFPHYLTQIIDPRGITALRSEYDEQGRLIKQIDAAGNETVFNRGLDATGRFERVKDRLGHETTYYYDERGNILLKIDPEGAQSTFTYYPDSDWVRFETDHYGNSKSFAYDARGNVTVETLGASLSDDPASPTTGYVTRTAYNSRGNPTSLTDPDGRLQTFTYDPASNNLLTHTTGLLDPSFPQSLTPSPSATTFTYLADGSIDSITDALGNVTQHTYDIPFADAAYPGAFKRVTVTVTDPAGSAGSDPANLTDTVLRTSHTIYDVAEKALAEIVWRTLPDGSPEEIITRHRYDADDRLVATVLPDGRVNETRYNAIGKESASVQWTSLADYESGDDTRARITSYGYDARGNQNSITYPDASTEENSFDAENRKVWSQDRRGARTFFEYDKVGRLTATIFPDDNDGLGAAAPSALNDPRLADNPRSTTIYDLVGRVRFQIDEEGATTEFNYEDGCGCAMRRKEMIQHLPDPAEGGPATAGLVTSYQYDNAGNVRFVTDPRGSTVETQYDDHGRPTHVIYPATDEHPSTQTVTTYDALGRRVAVTDQEGSIARYRYDALGRLIEVRQYLDQSLAVEDSNFELPTSNAGVVSTRYSYDESGNQTTQTDALGRVTTYETDSLGRRTKRLLPQDAAEPVALSESLDYDEWGQLWHRTDFAGHTTTFEYDVLGRLRAKVADSAHPSLNYSHAPARIEYEYDVAGEREAARTYHADGTLLYSETTPHDARGRLDFKQTTGSRLDYEYYENGLLKDVVSSNSGGVNIAYRYDALNRLAYVDDLSANASTVRTTSYGYNANGSLETLTYANGVLHSYQYDTLNRLRDLTVRNLSSVFRHQDYRLRASGHRRQILEGPAPAGPFRATTYEYDALYRLTGETISGDAAGHDGTVTYSLDKVGNRLGRTTTGPSLQERLPASTSTFGARDWLDSDTYDANGNTLASSLLATRYPLLAPAQDVYDFENRLIVRVRADGSSVNLGYDADGNRVGKTILSSAGQVMWWTTYLVDTNNLTGYAQVFEERTTTFDSAGVVVDDATKVFTYGSDLISQVEASTRSALPATRYFGYDGHGSVRELTDETGAVTDRYDYDAFGVLLRHEGTSDNAYLYCGEQWDEDLQLYFLRARYMNPDSGRFWNMDTYEGSRTDPISLHKYLYASANPVMGVDPSGRLTLAEQLTAAVVIGTIARIAIPHIVRGLLSEEDYDQLSACVNSFIAANYTIDGFNTVEIADSFAFLNAGLSASAATADLGIGWVIQHEKEFINSPAFLDWIGVDRRAFRKLPRSQRLKMMNSFRKGPLARLQAAQKVLSKVEIATSAAALAGQVFVGSAYAIATTACLLED